MNDVDIQKAMEGGMEIYAKAANYLKELSEDALCDNGPEENLPMILPAIVLKALACEIGLKTLLQIEGNSNEKEHNLNTLYRKVEECHRSEITQVLLAKMKKVNENYDEDKLIEDIEKVGKTFVEWRYFYEDSRHARITFLDEFYESIQMIVHSAM